MSVKWKWLLISFSAMTLLAIYFLAFKKDNDGFNIAILILKIFVYIITIIYFIVYGLEKYAENKLNKLN